MEEAGSAGVQVVAPQGGCRSAFPLHARHAVACTWRQLCSDSPFTSHDLYLGVKNVLLHFLLVTDDLNVFLTWRALLIPGSAVRKYSLVSDSTIYVKIDGDFSPWLGRDVF